MLIIINLFLNHCIKGAMDPRCAFALVLAKMDYSRCGGISKEKISKKGEKGKSGSGRHGAHTGE